MRPVYECANSPSVIVRTLSRLVCSNGSFECRVKIPRQGHNHATVEKHLGRKFQVRLPLQQVMRQLPVSSGLNQTPFTSLYAGGTQPEFSKLMRVACADHRTSHLSELRFGGFKR